MLKEEFGGDKKVGRPLLFRIEERIVKLLLPLVPKWLETYHLTLLTIVWIVFIIVSSFLAKYNINWLWLVSLMVLFQYITDLLDGKVGIIRNTGLVRWGYYMDHFLDYLFLCSLLIGYSFIVDDHFKYLLFFVLVVFGAFMVNSYLAFAATNRFRISYFGIGPTEARLFFIIINTYLIISSKFLMEEFLPYILILSIVGLFLIVYITQKEIWKIDMKNK